MDEFSIYWTIPKIFIERALNTIDSILTKNRQLWTKSMLEKEKAVIIRENAEIMSNPARYLSVFLQKKLLGEETPGTHPPETIEKAFRGVGLDDIRRVADNLSPVSAVLSIVGDDKKELISRYFSDWNGNKVTPKKLNVDPDPGIHWMNWDSSENYIGIGFLTTSKGNEEASILSVLGAVLTAFPTSRLYRRLRVERGLVYSVESGNISYIDTGFFGIFTSTAPKYVDDVIDTIFSELESIADGDLDEKEVEDMINLFFGALYNLTDSKYSLAANLAYNELFFGDPLRTYNELAQKIINLKPEHVTRIVRKYISRDKAVVCIIGKKEKDLKKIS